MKAILKKNQVIITALAIMIMIAGYLNFVKDTDTEDSETEENMAIENISDDYTDNDIADELNLSSISDDTLTDDYELLGINDNGEIISPDTEAIENSSDTGDAILASTVISDNYFSSAKLAREQVRAKNKELLMGVVESTTVTDEQKNDALSSILAMTETAELENATELLLEAKGFDGVVVSIVEDSVDVVVNCDSITDQQIAQIEDIVMRKADVAAECIVISAVIAQD